MNVHEGRQVWDLLQSRRGGFIAAPSGRSKYDPLAQLFAAVGSVSAPSVRSKYDPLQVRDGSRVRV